MTLYSSWLIWRHKSQKMQNTSRVQMIGYNKIITLSKGSPVARLQASLEKSSTVMQSVWLPRVLRLRWWCFLAASWKKTHSRAETTLTSHSNIFLWNYACIDSNRKCRNGCSPTIHSESNRRRTNKTKDDYDGAGD